MHRALASPVLTDGTKQGLATFIPMLQKVPIFLMRYKELLLFIMSVGYAELFHCKVSIIFKMRKNIYDTNVVKIGCAIAVICNMKQQRRNNVLIEQVTKRLIELHQERGLTQENVRFDLDLNIGRIEIGQHSISLTTLADLCNYYNITLCDFFKEISIK